MKGLTDTIILLLKGLEDKLTARLTALEQRPVGVVGEKGDPGEPGAPGPRGADGIDGLGFDDLEVEHDGERGFTLKFVQGARVKVFGTFVIPAHIYRGVYQYQKTYDPGDSVTWDGSLWVAMQATSAKPGGREPESRAWQLAVKKGADGRPAQAKAG